MSNKSSKKIYRRATRPFFNLRRFNMLKFVKEGKTVMVSEDDGSVMILDEDIKESFEKAEDTKESKEDEPDTSNK
jgi:hypothetical protein